MHTDFFFFIHCCESWKMDDQQGEEEYVEEECDGVEEVQPECAVIVENVDTVIDELFEFSIPAITTLRLKTLALVYPS